MDPSSDARRPPVPEVSADVLQARLDAGAMPGRDLLLLDCRTPEEWSAGRLPGAKLLPLGDLRHRRAELAGYEKASVVVYCHLGVRSMRFAEALTESGFEDVASLAGGIQAWVGRGGRVVRDG